MKTSYSDSSSRESNKPFESENPVFAVKRTPSGKTELNESESTIIQKNIDELSDKNYIFENQFLENKANLNEITSNPSNFEILIKTLETDIDLYKSFCLTEDQSVFLSF